MSVRKRLLYPPAVPKYLIGTPPTHPLPKQDSVDLRQENPSFPAVEHSRQSRNSLPAVEIVPPASRVWYIEANGITGKDEWKGRFVRRGSNQGRKAPPTKRKDSQHVALGS